MPGRHEEITSALPSDLNALPRLRGFRLRGLQMTRLEGFVDGTFAFTVTMLIIAGQQVPDDVATLLNASKHVPAFAASITVLAIFWRGHWTWSRRFGLEDGISIFISWTLIFTMLIYVYPLKVIFGGMFAALTDARLGQPIGVRSLAEARSIFALYALGFTAMAIEMVLLNLRAWHLRAALRLDEREKLMTLGVIQGWSIAVCTGLVSLFLAMVLPRALIGWSGWIYFSMAISVPLHAGWLRRRVARLPAR